MRLVASGAAEVGQRLILLIAHLGQVVIAQNGLSAQPIFGGPAYFIRNIIYNTPMHGAIKNGAANPAGVIIYHNTFVAENSHARGNSNFHYRNNLTMGTDHPEKPVFWSVNYTSYATMDYNGYRPNRNGRPQFVWKSPAAGVLREYNLSKMSNQEYQTLADFRRGTGQEEHGLELDYDIFVKVRPPDPSNLHAVHESRGVDFQLRPGTAAVDAGCRLPNVNEDFTGSAPDLGALEVGRPVPVYGPRKP